MGDESGSWRFELWTDGCARGERGGYAALALARDKNVPDAIIKRELPLATFRPGAKVQAVDGPYRFGFVAARGRCDGATSNRAELLAIIKGIETFTKPVSVTIFTDSQYCEKVLSGQWKARNNHDLIRRWEEASRGFEVHFQKVKAHNGNLLNEAVHSLAEEAMNGGT